MESATAFWLRLWNRSLGTKMFGEKIMWLDGTVTRKIFSKGTSVPANEPQGTFFDLEQILPDLRFSLVSSSPKSI